MTSDQSHSPETAELVKALCAAQAKIGDAELNAKNPHFGSNYADFSSVRRACKGPLAESGLAVTQAPQRGHQGWELHTTIWHVSGQWVRAVMPLKLERDNMQALGSALTYARRYALASLVGVAVDEEDDGERSIDRQKNPKKAEETRRNAVKARQNPAKGDISGPPKGPDDPISDAQRTRLHTISTNFKVPAEAVKKIITAYGFTSSRDITGARYDEIVERVSNWKPDMPENAMVSQ